MTAPAPAAPRATLTGDERPSMITDPAPDITVRRVDYRLEPFERGQGASVRYGAEGTCNGCSKVLRPKTKAVRLSDRLTWRCVPCAIKSGVLVEQARLLAGRAS